MQLKLINKKLEAKDTYSFIFEKPQGFDFVSGQYLYLTLPKLNYSDPRGETRHFTISSSPAEDFLQITTRIRKESGYKKTLNEISIGTLFEARGPFGSYVFDNSNDQKLNNIFLAGGIGITPFRSMIKYNFDKQSLASLTEKKQDNFLHLIYSNSGNDYVFKNELDLIQNENSFLKIMYVDTTIQGRIDEEKISSALSGWGLDKNSCIFWIVGPTGFVDAMEGVLGKMGINEERIKSEKFTGY